MSDWVSWTTAATLVAGFASGVLAGMFGIGGAIITTPAIRALGATPIQGVGSTVPAILPGSISGAYRYAREGLVSWRVGLVCGLAGSAFAVLGAWVADLVNAHWLMIATAGLLCVSGVSIFRSAKVSAPVPATGPEGDVAEALVVVGEHAREEVSVETTSLEGLDLGFGRIALVGSGAGLLAGLLGVGGGIVMVPAFTGFLKLPMKVALGSSLVSVAIFSIPALVTHAALGHIAWRYALPLVVGVVPGAQVGARFTLGASDVVVRRLFGAFVLVIAVVYGASEVLALR